MGPPPFGWEADPEHTGQLIPAVGEDLAAVVETFRQAGSYQRTAKLLNERGVPCKRAGRNDPRTNLPSIWRPLAVRRIIAREAPSSCPPGVASARARDSTASLPGCSGAPAGPP